MTDSAWAGHTAEAVSRLQQHVAVLADRIGERHLWRPSALHDAALYITRTFVAEGYAPASQRFEVHGIQVENIEAVSPGTNRADEILIVGAHYDTVRGCPGANDNATGVAAVLELARRFANAPRRRSVRFVTFVNEEPPWFQTPSMGSVVYANAARDRGDRIVGMLSLETMGCYSDEPGSQTYPAPLQLMFPNVGNFIGFVSNVRSGWLLRRTLRAFKARTAFQVRGAAVPAAIPGVGWSDHWSFWQAGYPALMVTDTAPYRYRWYHTAQDTPDKVSFPHLSAVVDGLEHVVHVLAGSRPSAPA